MLLDDKIVAILRDEPAYVDTSSDILTKELNNTGQLQTDVLCMIDILYYLLKLEFVHDNINLELYKYLRHLLDTTEVTVNNPIVNYIPTTIIPTITTSVGVTPLDFGSVRVGQEKILDFTFDAISTFSSIVISPPSDEFQVSTDPILGFGEQLVFIPIPGTGFLRTTKVYVKYKPIDVGSDTTTLDISITGVSTTTVNMIGTGVDATLSIAPLSLTFPSTSINTTSTPQSVTVIGTDLLSGVVMTASAGYKISLTQVGGYGSSVTVPLDINNNINTSVWVTFNPLITGTLLGTVTATNTELASIEVALTGVGQTAVITSSNTVLDFGSRPIGYPSTSLNTVVAGYNLVGDIVITSDSNFQISEDNATWGTSISLVPSFGIVPNTTIYCKFVPTDTTTYDMNIIITSDTATTLVVNCIGEGIISTLTTNLNDIFLGIWNTGLASDPKSFDIDGYDIVGDVTLTVATGTDFKLCKTIGGTYTNSIVVSPTVGNITQTIYVKFYPTIAIDYTNSVLISNDYINSLVVDLSGTGVEATLTVFPITLSFPNTVENTESAELNFNLSVQNLLNDVIVTAPTGFLVSKILAGTHTPSITYTVAEIDFNTTVYVIFAPTSAISYSGNITVTSIGANSKVVSVSGLGTTSNPNVTIAEPGNTKISYPLNIAIAQQSFVNTVNALHITGINIFCAASTGSTIIADVLDSSLTVIGTSRFVTINGNGSDKEFSILGGPINIIPGDTYTLNIYKSLGGLLSLVGLSNNTLFNPKSELNGVTQSYPIDISIVGTTT